VTRTYKRGLNAEQRKVFRSQMWEFRRRPEDLDEQQRAALEELFVRLPALRRIYELRWQLTDIFDTAPDRETAAKAIDSWRADVAASGLDWGRFVGMYERHRDGILAYFEERQTSGQVEGLNNKARVILKRAYGLKSTDSLWTRLILEVNRAGEKISRTIAEMHQLVHRIFTAFCCSYT
jgi:transposase